MFVKGLKHSASARAKMSAAHRGRQLSPEHRANIGVAQRGEKNHSWKGGRKKIRGYVLVLFPDHPYCDCMGYVLEHRLVMEAHLGRILFPAEVVHHINGIKDDNRIENLMRFDSLADHVRWHHKEKREKA